MPQVNLSNLSGPELRGLLDSTRQRGQAAQSYEILQEMAARRARAEGEPAPARVIAVDLGDPLERRDEAEVPPPADDFHLDLMLTGQDRPARRARERRARGPSGPRRPGKAWRPPVFVAGVAIGVVLGCGIAIESLSKPAVPAAAVFPQAPMLPPEPAAPPPAPPAELAVAEAPPTPPVETEPAPAAAEVAEAAVPASAEQPEASTAIDEKLAELAAAPAPDRCTREATPADRTICEEPRLKDLQRELREAYADALQAHSDRALLRQRQLAWRDARNDVGDPQRLARLYETRIRKLHAAAEAAREAR